MSTITITSGQAYTGGSRKVVEVGDVDLTGHSLAFLVKRRKGDDVWSAPIVKRTPTDVSIDDQEAHPGRVLVAFAAEDSQDEAPGDFYWWQLLDEGRAEHLTTDHFVIAAGAAAGVPAAADVPFAPVGDLEATNVQDAIAEAASEAGPGGPVAASAVTFDNTVAGLPGDPVDVQGAIEGVAAGGGLPPTWTDGGNGDVTATVDTTGAVALTLEQIDDATEVLALKAGPGATAMAMNLLTVYDDTGTDVADWDASGHIDIHGGDNASIQLDGSGTAVFRHNSSPSAGQPVFTAGRGAGGTYWRINAPGGGTQFQTDILDPTDLGWQFSAATAQSADMVNFYDENFDLGLRIDKRGGLVVGVTSEPANADLAASQAAIWFDDTNGAAKLMIKGKTADGTVVEGEIALS